MLMRVATSYGSQSAQVGAAIRFVLCYCRASTGSALIPKLRAVFLTTGETLFYALLG